MINEETRRKLRELSLEEMITALDLQEKDSGYQRTKGHAAGVDCRRT